MRNFIPFLIVAAFITLSSNVSIAQCTTEVCDGVDNDCDGSTDEGFSGVYYQDNDGDGKGGSMVITTSCQAVANGYVTTSGDCDDNNVNVWMGKKLYIDADGDGYHGGEEFKCFGNALPTGYDSVTLGPDCNDTSAATHTGATEICDGLDNDCDGKIDEGFWRQYFIDNDHDGFGYGAIYATSCDAALNGYATKEGDCNDANPSVWNSKTMWVDNDHDGYSSGSAAIVCFGNTVPPGYILTSTGVDCDDSDPNTHPGAAEINDGKDNDCDYFTDEGFLGPPIGKSDHDGDGRYVYFYAQHDRGQGDCNDFNPAVWNSKMVWIDADGDGYASSTQYICFGNTIPAGFKTKTLGFDCDDSKASVYQGAIEKCDGIDNDCDGFVDEGFFYSSPFYFDSDGDGFGRPNPVYFSTCETIPAGYVTNVKDCDDGDSALWRSELLYFDNDGDGYYGSVQWICYGNNIPPKYSKTTRGHDCNDMEAAAYTNAAEICDGIDNDCDGAIDEDFYRTYYFDSDGDGYGQAAIFITSCQIDSRYVLRDGDCFDSDSIVHPGAVELCDGVDNDCDGQIDEDPVPPSIASITAGTNFICPGTTTTLTANGVKGTAAVVTWWTEPGGTGTQLGTGLTLTNAGVDTFYARVTGSCGPAAEKSFIVKADSTKPVINCPSSVDTTTTANSCARSIRIPDPLYSDNCAVALLTWKMAGATTLTSPATGINKVGTQIFNKGTTIVTYTIKDSKGNISKCSFNVVIRDNVKPLFATTNTNITDSVVTGCSKSIRIPAISTSDNCITRTLTWAMSGATTASGTGPIGIASFNVGKTLVTYTLADASGNSRTSSFIVTLLDKKPPVINCPPDTTVTVNDTSCSKNVRTTDPVFSDNCSLKSLTWKMTGATTGASATTGIGLVRIKTFNAGTTTITYTARDSSGNTATCSFTVTVNTTGSCNSISSRAKNGFVEESQLLKVKLSPNPASHSFMLRVVKGTRDAVDITVYSSDGRRVQQLKGLPWQPVSFGEEYKKGSYLIEVRQGGKRTSVTGVKQ